MRKISHILVFSFSGLIAGCSTPALNLIETGVVELKIKKTHPVFISRASAYEDDGEMVIRGEARFPSATEFGVFRGHIDIDVVSPGEKKIQMHDVRVHRQRIPGKRGRVATFVARVPLQAQKGASILLEYAQTPHYDGI